MARWAAAALLLAVQAQALGAQMPAGNPGMQDDSCTGEGSSRPVNGSDWAGLCRYRAANAALAPATAVRAVFVGDSITENWLAADPDLFAEGLLGRGISGQTSTQVLVRFWQDAVALKPRIVHILIGTNDIAGNTGPTTPEAYKNAIRAMAAIARQNRIVVILGSIPPARRYAWAPGSRPDIWIAPLNAWLRGFAQDEGLVFADYHGALAGPQGELPPAFGADGVHPNRAGYAAMRPVVDRALTEAQARVAALDENRSHADDKEP